MKRQTAQNRIVRSVKIGENEKITYVSSGIFDRSIPVVSVEENITAPVNIQDIEIARYFYNSDDSEEQKAKSVVFYDNVYMPNTGIDYKYKDKFDVLTIYSGTVVDVSDNELMGKTVEIRHNNELISVYQGLDNVEVQKGDIVGFGNKIGTSGTSVINKDSLIVLKDCLIEETIKDALPESSFQFMRNGYFCVDKDSTSDKLIFNRTVSLKDNWQK